MRFKKFLERSGGGLSPEDTKTTGSGRQQEMPGTQMTLGDLDAEGPVTQKRMSDDGNAVILSVDDRRSGEGAEVQIPRDIWRAKGAPEVGAMVRIVYNKNNEFVDLSVTHDAQGVTFDPTTPVVGVEGGG